MSNFQNVNVKISNGLKGQCQMSKFHNANVKILNGLKGQCQMSKFGLRGPFYSSVLGANNVYFNVLLK